MTSLMEETPILDIDELDDESPQLYEHYRFVVDKGQVPLRIDKYMCEKMQHTTATASRRQRRRVSCMSTTSP